MKIYLILLVIIAIAVAGYFLFIKKEEKEELSLKDKLTEMPFKAFKEEYPHIDRLKFIEIRNSLRHDPDGITEEYLRDLLDE